LKITNRTGYDLKLLVGKKGEEEPEATRILFNNESFELPDSFQIMVIENSKGEKVLQHFGRKFVESTVLKKRVE
jgi:hypothetical protein